MWIPALAVAAACIWYSTLYIIMTVAGLSSGGAVLVLVGMTVYAALARPLGPGM